MQDNTTDIKSIDRKILDVMNTFTDGSDTETDRRNFDALKSIQSELMTRYVAGEFDDKDISPFLHDFLREFDNTYALGLPEAMIIALKRGERVNLQSEWWKNNGVNRNNDVLSQ
jgi:hypothetical protein